MTKLAIDKDAEEWCAEFARTSVWSYSTIVGVYELLGRYSNDKHMIENYTRLRLLGAPIDILIDDLLDQPEIPNS